MLLQLLQHLSNDFHVLFAFAFGIDKDVIEVQYHKNVELLCQDLIDIALKYGQYIGHFRRHYLVLKMAIAGPKSCFLFIALPNPYLIVGIDQIELGEMSSLT